jgi:hypothetical protein
MRHSAQMQNLQLGWQQGAALCGVLAGASVVVRRVPSTRLRGLQPYLRESAIIAALYALWQLAASLSVLGTAGAFARARWIVRVQHDWHLPSEASAQRLILGHPLWAQACNWFYAAAHFSTLGLLLVWMFMRHRDRYPEVRNVLVALTASSLFIQLIPVAPPRLLPDLGFVDVAQQYNESVYSVSGLSVDELGAMPSVHVGWALLIAWAVIRLSNSRWRWWILAHPALTIFVVAATANHFWLDGIVAGLLLLVSIAGVGLLTRTDNGDAGWAGAGHRGQSSRDLVEADNPGH